jgi:hypothetical protein
VRKRWICKFKTVLYAILSLGWEREKGALVCDHAKRTPGTATGMYEQCKVWRVWLEWYVSVLFDIVECPEGLRAAVWSVSWTDWGGALLSLSLCLGPCLGFSEHLVGVSFSGVLALTMWVAA